MPAVGRLWPSDDDDDFGKDDDDDQNGDDDDDDDDDDLYIIGAVCGSRKMSTSSWESPVTT